VRPPGVHRPSVGLVIDPAVFQHGELGVRATVQMRF